VYAYLNHFFGWLEEREIVDGNPLRAVRPPRMVPARERVLGDREIVSLWSGDTPMPAICRIQLLTAQRVGFIMGMRWQDVSFDPAVWSIPPEAMKSGKSHIVPLSELALAELERWPRLDGPFVFGVGSSGGSRSMASQRA
jgi:integrase